MYACGIAQHKKKKMNVYLPYFHYTVIAKNYNKKMRKKQNG
nr:MAG TPA: hypothetical protein [Caudoviricetes sp.]